MPASPTRRPNLARALRLPVFSAEPADGFATMSASPKNAFHLKTKGNTRLTQGMRDATMPSIACLL